LGNLPGPNTILNVLYLGINGGLNVKKTTGDISKGTEARDLEGLGNLPGPNTILNVLIRKKGC